MTAFRAEGVPDQRPLEVEAGDWVIIRHCPHVTSSYAAAKVESVTPKMVRARAHNTSIHPKYMVVYVAKSEGDAAERVERLRGAMKREELAKVAASEERKVAVNAILGRGR